MKRDLLKQMRNEWRDNLWLIVELLVVFVAIWGLGMILFAKTKGLFLPMGIDKENVYSLTSKTISKDNPNFVAVDSLSLGYMEDLRQIVRTLSQNQNVEGVGIHSSIIPYNYNYNGQNLDFVDGKDSITYMGNVRYGSPEMVKVMGIKSLTGASSEQLTAMLARGEILISDNPRYEKSGGDPKKLIGRKVYLDGDSTKIYRIGDVVQQIRRTEYEASWAGGIIIPIGETGYWGDIAVKVKPGRDMQFKEDFKNNPELRKYRNVYLSDLKSLDSIRELCQRNDEVTVRTFVALMFFLLITIFLGLLGTFWFRMQQRVSEIAIRKVCGASRNEIFRRILSEGMILLICAVIVVSAFIWSFIGKFENILGEEWYVFLIGEAITFAIVAVGIIVSVWYPARKAMNIEPAEAVKAE